MKVIICDDQAIVRDGLEMLLKLEPDFKVVGVAEDGAAAVEMAAKEKPDLVLMASKQLARSVPDIRILKSSC
jgi:DNA-binding NarL/FixJ family response regulator